jgi:hypothetical protein
MNSKKLLDIIEEQILNIIKFVYPVDDLPRWINKGLFIEDVTFLIMEDFIDSVNKMLPNEFKTDDIDDDYLSIQISNSVFQVLPFNDCDLEINIIRESYYIMLGSEEIYFIIQEIGSSNGNYIKVLRELFIHGG